MSSTAPFAFILSWQRPLYLWACLDSFYRETTIPCRFVIADNASPDPAMREVIRGFERRGMFHAVHLCDDNDPLRFEKLIAQYHDEIGEFFVLIEGDTAVMPGEPGWLEVMRDHFAEDPMLGSLGSRVYQPDFVAPDEAERLEPDLSEKERTFLIKANAPMRRYRHTHEPLIAPHNPPLRLLGMRKAAYDRIGFGRDTQIHKRMIADGWKSMISTRIVHRHLSLLNIYDYAEYGERHRDAFFEGSRTRRAEEPR